MKRSGGIAAALAGGCLAVFIASCSDHHAVAQGPMDPDVLAARALLDGWHGDSGKLLEARDKLVQVLGRDPQNYAALHQMARFRLMNGYINGSYAYYRGNMYLVENYNPGVLMLAERDVQTALRIKPDYAEGYIALAHIQLQQHKVEEAAQSLARAEHVGTDDPWLHLNWAVVDDAKGDHPAARDRAQRVLNTGTTRESALTFAYEELIREYDWMGDGDKVLALYVERIGQKPDDPWLRGEYAAYLTNTLGRNDEAIKQARSALETMNYGIGRQTLAMALYRKWADLVTQGNPGDGERYFREASGIFPDLSQVMARGASAPAGLPLAKVLAGMKNVSIDARDDDGSTALLIATNKHLPQVVQALLALHANPNLADENGLTPLLSAADDGQTDIVNMLLASGADIHAKWNGLDAATMAARNGMTDLAAALTKRAAASK